jgi:hypothetical protein
MTPLDAADLHHEETLRKLALEINESYRMAHTIAIRGEEMMECAIMQALLAGHKLIEVKTLVTQREFKTWIAKYCPEISYEVAVRYIALAKLSFMADVGDSRSLRQAWAAVVSEKANKIPKPALADIPKDFLNTKPVCAFRFPRLVKIDQSKPIGEWEQAKRRNFLDWLEKDVRLLLNNRNTMN